MALVELQVRGVDRWFGFDDDWVRRGAVACGECGSWLSPHWCEPRADFMQKFFRGLCLTDGDFWGEPFEPVDWVDVAIDVVWGVIMWDSNARVPGWYRLIQDVSGNIVRGQMKTTFEKGVACWWLATQPRNRVGAFSQQNKEETVAKFVPGVLDMIDISPVMQGCEYRWIGQTRQPGGSDRFTRGEGRGEVSLRMVSPNTVSSAQSGKGPRYSFGLFDETGFMREGEMLIDEVVKKANLTVPDPLWLQFSTQSPDPAHYQRRQCSMALEVLANPRLNPRLWPICLVSDATVNVFDREVPIRLGPLFRLGIASTSIIDQELAEAKLDAAKLNTYARERCGFAGDYAVRFMGRDDWIGCAAKGGRAEILERMKGLPIYVGSDFSEMSDFSAACLFAVDHNGVCLALPYHFIPSSAKARLDALTRGKVGDWIRNGWLEELPEGEDLPERVARRVLEIIEPIRDDVMCFGYDRWHAENAAIVWRDAGWAEDNGVLIIAQGAGLNTPIKAAPKYAEHRKLLHPGDPVFDYCVMSAATEADSKDPDKSRLVKVDRGSAAERIDGVVAWMTAWQTRIAQEYYRSKQPPKPAPKPYLPPWMKGNE